MKLSAVHDGSRPAVTYAILTLVMAAVYGFMAIARMADFDEGAYLIAAKLVARGKLLYHDFYYPQMPLLPYVYGAWMTVFGMSWYAARALSALLAIGLGLALYRYVARLTGQPSLAFLATVLFTFSGLGFSWYPSVKTFALPTLLVFLSCTVLDSGIGRWKYVLSGLLLGLAVDVRFYVLVVVLTLAVEVVRREPDRNPLRSVGLLMAGLVGAVAPTLFFVFIGPDTFIFNVLGVHAIRSGGMGTIGDFWQKAGTLFTLLTVQGSEGATSLQFTILLFLNVAFVVSRLAFRERLPPSASIAGLLLLVSLLPTPTYTQYACMPLPFMVVNAALLVSDIARGLDPAAPAGAAHRLKHALLLLGGLYIAVTPADFYRYTVGWDAPPYFAVQDWKIPTISRIGRAIDAELPADNPIVITWWPGYVIESRASILPGTENHLNLMYSASLTPEEIGRYHYMSPAQLVRSIRHHRAGVVVLGGLVFDDKPQYRQILRESGYVMVNKVGTAEIYRLDRTRS